MPTNKAIKRRNTQRRAAGDEVDNDLLIDDLNLDIDDEDVDDSTLKRNQKKSKKSQQSIEEDIVFDRRNKKNLNNANVDHDEDNEADDIALAVSPREAHHDAREGIRGVFGKKHQQQQQGKNKNRDEDLFDVEDTDEATIATMMSRKDRKRLDEADFDFVGIEGLSSNIEPEAAPLSKEDRHLLSTSSGTAQQDTAILQVNSVASRFASLSASERFKMIKEQSPEVEKLMRELEKNLHELKTVFAPLRSALFERKKAMQTAGDSLLLEFLETKVQLMLSYCVHILFYLLLKVEGTKIQNHPVLKRLVELRVYMEKLHPVEQRLQHSISRLLSGEQTESARLSKLRPVESSSATISMTDKKDKYVAKKTAPVIDELRQRRRAEALADQMQAIEQEEERTMKRKRMTRAEAAKFSGALDQVPVDAQMGEEEDQFLTNATSFLSAGGVDDDDNNAQGGMSLIEKLRARKKLADQQQQQNNNFGGTSAVKRVDLVAGNNNKKQQKENKKRSRLEQSMEEQEMMNEGEEGEGEGEFEGGGEDDELLDYDALLAEQEEREEDERSAKRHRAENIYEEPEKARREIDQDIQKHRGLTKLRPKDRKNPRVNQRRKYKIGLRVAKAHSKTATGGADRDGNVPLKTHVTHSTRLD